MQELLDTILMSKNPTRNFFEAYNKTIEFKNWIIGILPEIDDCYKLKQDNPWHIYGCLEHILCSVKEINKQSEDCDEKTRRMLAYTMLLHDIGKPECKIRRYSKLYKREIDSFFNHNKAGVKVADRVLNDFGFNEKEREIVKTLIDMHDVFMYITLKENGNPHHRKLTKEYMKELIEELDDIYDGKKMMKYLIWVGRADNKAQNPEMTKDSLILLDKMIKLLQKIKEENEVKSF